MQVMKKEIREKEDFRTERQWNLAGRAIIDGANGERYWTNGFCSMVATYFPRNQTREMTEEETRSFKEAGKAVKKAREEKRREQEEQERKQWEVLMQYHTACQWLSMGYVPKDDAQWQLGEKLNPGKNESYPLGSKYYYCHEKDVVQDLQRATELSHTFDEYFRNNPNDWYDGSAWW